MNLLLLALLVYSVFGLIVMANYCRLRRCRPRLSYFLCWPMFWGRPLPDRLKQAPSSLVLNKLAKGATVAKPVDDMDMPVDTPQELKLDAQPEEPPPGLPAVWNLLRGLTGAPPD